MGELTGRPGRRYKQLLEDRKEKRGYRKLKEGSTRSHSLENSLWKRLRTCRKTDCYVIKSAALFRKLNLQKRATHFSSCDIRLYNQYILPSNCTNRI
jgi:hypothetical protein